MEKGGQDKIIHCSHCGNPLNVSGLSPYTQVKCNHCNGLTRTSDRLGKYRIVRRLGVGGMSLVFCAVDDTLGREVALKVLNQTYSAQPERVKMFEREARVMAMVSHPNVVKIYSVGESDGQFYIAMELVEGSNLEAKINGGDKLSELESLQIALEVAEGLNAGYEAGVLHRDMKPANVLINNRGEAQIVDFGLALLAGDLSDEEEIWVTPHYAPPETLRREPEDFRSDIYALGATLYHLFSGRPSITSDSQSINELLELKKTVPPLGQAAPHISVDTCRLVDRAMAFDPAHRFPSYEALIDSLRKARGRVERGTAISWTGLARLRKRRRMKKTLFLCLGGGAACAAVFLLAMGGKKPAATAPPPTRPQIVEKTLDSASLQERKKAAQRKMGELYVSARNAFEQGRYGEAAGMFSQVAASADTIEITALWAFVEGYMSFLFDGRKAEGDALLESMEERMTSSPLSAERKIFLDLAAKMKGNALPSDRECGRIYQEFPAIYFLTGCKAWLMGDWGRAETLLKKQEKTVAENYSDPAWIKNISRMAARERTLLARMKEWDSLPQDGAGDLRKKGSDGRDLLSKEGWMPAVKKLIEEEVAFLEREAKLQEGREKELWRELAPVRERPDSREGLVLLKQGRFAEASACFDRQAARGGAGHREIFRELADLSEAALSFVESAATCSLLLQEKGEKHPFKDGQGREVLLETVQAGSPVLQVNGNKSAGEWSDIPPSFLLSQYELGREFTSSMSDDSRRKMDSEAAVFAFLTGERARARQLADRIVRQDQSFGKEWKRTVALLIALEI